MKLNKLHIIYIFVAAIGLWTLPSNSTGKMGVSTTGCGGGGCHGTINSATSISMDFDGNSSLTSYTPGKKYTIVLNIDNSNLIGTATAKAGFDLNFSSGTLSNTPAGTMLMTRELHHTTPKAMTPAAGSGNVTINIAANGVNGTGNETGDAWNIKTISLTEFIAPKKANISAVASASITTTSATINAQVNANGNASSAEVQYGLTTAYGSTKAMTPASITGTTNTAVTASLTGLTANTTYNYRIKTNNIAGDSLSANSTFKTTSAGAAVFNSEEMTVTVYPNPSADFVIIRGQEVHKFKEITLINMSGKRVSVPVTQINSQEIKLNTVSLSKGMYYIQLNSKNYSKSFPLVIEK